MLSGHKMESRAEQKPWKRLIEHILPLVKYSRSKIVRKHINEYTDRVIQKEFDLEIQTMEQMVSNRDRCWRQRQVAVGKGLPQ